MKKHDPLERHENQTKGSVIGSHADLPKEHEPVLHIIADMIVGLILLGVLLIVKLGFEQLPICQRLEESGYDLLQLRLSSKLDAKTLKVIVVDITDMRMDRHPFQRKYDYTNRDDLQDLIQKIAAEQPSAIGLDTDFTPYADQQAQDLQFLDFCLSLKRPGSGSERLPVYVGLHEAVAFGPALCLGEPRFGVLAAFIGFPNVKEDEPRKWMVERLKLPWDCPSLAAGVTQEHINPPSPWIAWATEKMTFIEGYDYSGTKFMIDYSPLNALENNSVPLHDLDSYLRRNYFRDKYVLIGRGKLSRDAEDKYPIPGRPGNSHAEVYVHACAAYTLLRRPLFPVTGKRRIGLDILLAVLVIFGVAAVRYRYRRQADRVAPQRVLAFFTVLAVLVAIGVGFFMVNVTRLRWDDFLLVAASLLLQRSMESNTEGLTEWLVHSLAGARSLVLRPPVGSAKDEQDED